MYLFTFERMIQIKLELYLTNDIIIVFTPGNVQHRTLVSSH